MCKSIRRKWQKGYDLNKRTILFVPRINKSGVLIEQFLISSHYAPKVAQKHCWCIVKLFDNLILIEFAFMWPFGLIPKLDMGYACTTSECSAIKEVEK